MREAGHKYGRELAKMVLDRTEGRDPIQKAKDDADKITANAHAEVETILKGIAPIFEVLGIEFDANHIWKARYEIEDRLKTLAADRRVNASVDALKEARRILDNALGKIAA